MKRESIHEYKGFVLKSGNGRLYDITLEDEFIDSVPSVEIGKKRIDFFYTASSVSFHISKKRAEKLRKETKDAAGSEPELSSQGRPSVHWVRWYRAVSGCGLREAYEEACQRIENAQARQE